MNHFRQIIDATITIFICACALYFLGWVIYIFIRAYLEEREREQLRIADREANEHRKTVDLRGMRDWKTKGDQT
jgi:hypothetical protein